MNNNWQHLKRGDIEINHSGSASQFGEPPYCICILSHYPPEGGYPNRLRFWYDADDRKLHDGHHEYDIAIFKMKPKKPINGN